MSSHHVFKVINIFFYCLRSIFDFLFCRFCFLDCFCFHSFQKQFQSFIVRLFFKKIFYFFYKSLFCSFKIVSFYCIRLVEHNRINFGLVNRHKIAQSKPCRTACRHSQRYACVFWFCVFNYTNLHLSYLFFNFKKALLKNY